MIVTTTVRSRPLPCVLTLTSLGLVLVTAGGQGRIDCANGL